MEEIKIPDSIKKNVNFVPQQERPRTIVDVMLDVIMTCETKFDEALKLVKTTPVSNNNFGRYLDNLTSLIQTSQSYRNILNNARAVSEAKAKEEPKKE